MEIEKEVRYSILNEQIEIIKKNSKTCIDIINKII